MSSCGGDTLTSVGSYAALGDSFTAGAEAVDAVRPWPDEVAKSLALLRSDFRYDNLGRAGARSDDIVAFQLDRAIYLRPELISVVAGANDVLLSTRPDIALYTDNLSRVLSRLAVELPDSKLMTATTPNFGRFLLRHPRSRRRLQEGLEDMNAATRRVAAELGVTCIELAAHPRSLRRENFSEDAIHPSAQGRDFAARVVAQTLEQSLGIRVRPSAQTVG